MIVGSHPDDRRTGDVTALSRTMRPDACPRSASAVAGALT
jgi:hypothetical protein